MSSVSVSSPKSESRHSPPPLSLRLPQHRQLVERGVIPPGGVGSHPPDPRLPSGRKPPKKRSLFLRAGTAAEATETGQLASDRDEDSLEDFSSSEEVSP
eukprot:7957689-Pyramimonas_sp.AAC.1